MLEDLLKSPQKITQLAKRYLETGSFTQLEREFDLEPGEFTKVFSSNPELEVEFNGKVIEESEKERALKAPYQVGKIIDRLFNITESIEDEPKVINQAAGIILNYYSKVQQKGGKREDEDDLDKLWKEITQEDKRKYKT